MPRPILVPEGMLKAAQHAFVERFGYPPSESVLLVLACAVRWLSENPIEATYRDWLDFVIELPEVGTAPFPGWWQRRMFLAPEPPIPEEVKCFLWPPDYNSGTPENHNWQIINAYRLGKESK